jgi:hypothetical protein
LYLHGAIVQEQGIHAVSEDFGPYEYLAILDSLRNHGFLVLSEARKKGTAVADYGLFVSKQVDTLLAAGVPASRIVIVGASQGAAIALEAAHILRNKEVKFALLGLCNEYNVKYFSKYRNTLCGNFLSIYEASDQKLSCENLLSEESCKSGYQEIRLTMGNGHGFLYRPHNEWVLPIVRWAQGS